MSLVFIFSDPFCCVLTRCMYGLRYCDHITQVNFCLPSPCHISMLISGLPGLSYSNVEVRAGCQVKIKSDRPNKRWKYEREETGGKEEVCVL